MTNEIQKFNFQPESFDQALRLCDMIANSDLAPKDYKGKPGNVLIAMQLGMEIGLKPMQAIQNIAVINGRPTVWGDAMLALVQASHLCEYIKETIKDGKAYCAVKRVGQDEHIATFSMDDAKKAGLIGKPGPWSQYPERMLQMRARGFALRDKFSDVLKGIVMREEVEDYQVIQEDKKESAASFIDQLVEQKNDNVVLLDKIENAHSVEDLKLVKSEISELLKKKHAELVNADTETGEVKQGELVE